MVCNDSGGEHLQCWTENKFPFRPLNDDDDFSPASKSLAEYEECQQFQSSRKSSNSESHSADDQMVFGVVAQSQRREYVIPRVVCYLVEYSLLFLSSCVQEQNLHFVTRRMR